LRPRDDRPCSRSLLLSFGAESAMLRVTRYPRILARSMPELSRDQLRVGLSGPSRAPFGRLRERRFQGGFPRAPQPGIREPADRRFSWPRRRPAPWRAIPSAGGPGDARLAPRAVRPPPEAIARRSP